MGTRADFYVGRGPNAEWIGSIAFDGYPDGIGKQVLNCTSEEAFRHAVNDFFSGRDDVTRPEQGWPWPWDNSNTTDYAYAYDSGDVFGTCFGHGWWPANKPQPEDDNTPKILDAAWPDMSEKKKVAWGNRSGLLIISKQN